MRRIFLLRTGSGELDEELDESELDSEGLLLMGDFLLCCDTGRRFGEKLLGRGLSDLLRGLALRLLGDGLRLLGEGLRLLGDGLRFFGDGVRLLGEGLLLRHDTGLCLLGDGVLLLLLGLRLRGDGVLLLGERLRGEELRLFRRRGDLDLRFGVRDLLLGDLFLGEELLRLGDLFGDLLRRLSDDRERSLFSLPRRPFSELCSFSFSDFTGDSSSFPVLPSLSFSSGLPFSSPVVSSFLMA